MGSHHKGLNMIEKHLSAGHEFLQPFAERIINLAVNEYDEADLKKIICETRKFKNQLMKELKKGRDHLLELNSFNKKRAEKIVENIKIADNDKNLDNYLLKALNLYLTLHFYRSLRVQL